MPHANCLYPPHACSTAARTASRRSLLYASLVIMVDLSFQKKKGRTAGPFS